MANMKITEIEGIGPAYGEKLVAAGIKDTDALLNAGKTKKGRAELAEKTGIAEKQILRWVNHTDLYRIKGVGPEFAELMEAAGVDTVKELRTRNAANLATKMVEVNAEKKLTRQVPSETVCEKWIAEAKTLDPMVSH